MAEQKVLVNKAMEFSDIIQSDKKDAQTCEQKRWAWDRIATSVNEVNTTGSLRNGKDCNAKFQQMKCRAGGDLELLKRQAISDYER